ncbi:MAG: hypothetical protein A3F84_10015 [Candidatus Handelsmanbacteria bacterium RIFCSPLOWO2_12_FULL_64_10]|uniref:Uncharacterized protein n=1 Tax=Handelsmanbacteria sp. (strain RIFCSPLOWO2_12_FULL_64_10) TaxID=1817868 RepID=A0A1F6CUB0_HANXR|nr:MAG: hypothetical protein A3F84_10015 [Candidatus Handelsmanbacteria bacterium RIFCSPLOWO2_12_FULL_64_10]
MLIRSVEFQDSFARAPVEGARQLSLDLNRPDLLHRHMAQVAVEQAAQDQNRPLASEQPEDSGIDPNSRPLPERPQQRRRGRRREPEEEHHPPHVSTTGTHVDFVA